ncbi:beta-lactamase family protein [Aquincola sp. S2]|uniref:Beta-lactamase family protein n=1 Tax=Pseudaquabacterium terrae TaxID=2732868 RepID=A0ABX2EJZ1_9BURK|nr:serine hydrolase domain-containing protein [Aquabacterium terrae]NRF68930.1 beta-lactamase family protein [Aquabacterium terrae]
MHAPTVQGRCAARFEPLRARFAALFANDEDLGASLAVTLDGEPVVDLWGGHADEARTRPWRSDTLTHVWSTTKTMTSLAALLLVERGELNVDAPVRRYWPEFGAAGKGEVLVRHLLGHTSGVSGWEQPVNTDVLCDWDLSTRLLAAQSPWWAPGSASGYHALNYGHLVGEVVRRITGQKLGRFFAEQIAQPLGADFHIGLPASESERVARVVPPPPLPIDMATLDPASPMFKTLTNPLPDATVSWTPAWQQADIGAANGHGNARSVARIQSLIACGGEVDGVRLLSPQTIERIFEPQAEGMDLVLGLPMRMGLGWGLPQPALLPFIPEGRVCFWGGWGGSIVINDADRRLTFAYMMNRMAPGIIGGPNAAALSEALYRCVG